MSASCTEKFCKRWNSICIYVALVWSRYTTNIDILLWERYVIVDPWLQVFIYHEIVCLFNASNYSKRENPTNNWVEPKLFAPEVGEIAVSRMMFYEICFYRRYT